MALLCIYLSIACFFDYRDRRIPNLLPILIGLTGLIRAGGNEGLTGLFACVIRMLILMALLYPFFKIATLGAGDVKLFGTCAGFLPAEKILVFLLLSMLVAAIVSLIHFIRKKDVKERFEYLFSYVTEVLCSGHWQLYIAEKEKRKSVGICMAGPILCSILLYLGGVY